MNKKNAKKVMLDVNNNIVMSQCRVNAIKSLTEIIYTEIFDTIYETTQESLLELKYKVDFYNDLSFLISDYMINIVEELNEAEKRINKFFKDIENQE